MGLGAEVMSNRVPRLMREDVALPMLNSAGMDWMAGGGMPDIIAGLYKEGHLTGDQARSVGRLLYDMQAAHGSSAGLVTAFADRVSGRGAERFFLASCGDVVAFERMERALASLHRHELDMLAFLICARERERGALADLGRSKSAYTTAKTQRANAVGRISSFADSISEMYAAA